jgi:hypothetical protein
VVSTKSVENMRIAQQYKLRWTVGLMLAAISPLANAQVCGPTYSVQPQTFMEPQIEKRMRVVYDLVYEDQEVVSQRPVLRTRVERQAYSVTVPVVETNTVEERYTVLRPVTKREWVDQSYDQTTYVTETAEREETYTTYRPVVETSYVTQNYVVQRPVTETQFQTQQYTSYQPVTTFQNAVVDQGQYVAQQYYQPGDTRYGLRWVPGGFNTDPTGMGAYRRGGLGWVPYTSPGNTFAQLMYQPNPVQVAVPQTTLMPQVQQVQVPVTVTKMQAEVVQQQVPVNTTRMEATQETRRVPYSVQRPVVQRIERMVPVDRIEYVEQEMVRPKTVQRTSYKIETRERDVPVQFYETEAIKSTVRVARRVPRYEEYEVLKLVPRVVQSPMVLSYVDPYSVPLSMGVSPWLPSSGGTGSGSNETVTYGQSRPLIESPSDAVQNAAGRDNAQGSDAGSQTQRLRKIETRPSDVEELPDAKNFQELESVEEIENGDMDLNSSAGSTSSQA